MCYHVSFTKKQADIEKKFPVKVPPELELPVLFHISGFAFPQLPVISQTAPHTVELMHWGLIPSWVKSEHQADEIKAQTLNARSETVTEKPSFRSAVKNRRCLILLDGFFEWQTVGKVKQPWYIFPAQGEILALGGLYDVWVNRETGEEKHSFSVVTTQANHLMAKIHNDKKRMPLIFGEGNEMEWLRNDLGPDDLKKLMVPAEDGRLDAYEVPRWLGSRNRDTNVPEARERMGNGGDVQGNLTLF